MDLYDSSKRNIWHVHLALVLRSREYFLASLHLNIISYNVRDNILPIPIHLEFLMMHAVFISFLVLYFSYKLPFFPCLSQVVQDSADPSHKTFLHCFPANAMVSSLIPSIFSIFSIIFEMRGHWTGFNIC